MFKAQFSPAHPHGPAFLDFFLCFSFSCNSALEIDVTMFVLVSCFFGFALILL